MHSILSTPSSTSIPPTVALRKHNQKVDNILVELEKPLFAFQSSTEGNRIKKRTYDEMTMVSTTSVLRARVLNILAAKQLLGYKLLHTEECANLLNAIPIKEFKGLVRDIYNSCEEPHFVRSVQRALNHMRLNPASFQPARIKFLQKYPFVSFVRDVLNDELVDLMKSKIRQEVIQINQPGWLWRTRNWLSALPTPGNTERYPIFWKRFAVSVQKNRNRLFFKFREAKKLALPATMDGLEPAIEKTVRQFVKHMHKMGVNVTRNTLGVQTFLMHGHVRSGELYPAVDWHRDYTAFGVPDYIMVLMIGDRKGEFGWKGGQFWCFKGENEEESNTRPLVKLNTEFNQGIILKNDEAYHFVSEVEAKEDQPAMRDILILDLYLNWENVSQGLLVDEEND